VAGERRLGLHVPQRLQRSERLGVLTGPGCVRSREVGLIVRRDLLRVSAEDQDSRGPAEWNRLSPEP
jgi:hypothetical protein